MLSFESDRDFEAEITANIQNLEKYYGLNKVNSLKQLVQIITDPKKSEIMFRPRNVTVSSIFQQKGDPGQLNQEHIKVFAKKYSFQKLVEKFPKPKGQINGMLIGILQQKLAKQTITSHQTRKNIWMLASGARFNMNYHKGLYQELVSYDTYPDYFAKVIKKDITRTVVRNEATEQDLRALNNVLMAFSRRNPYVGYCQGMNFVVYFLLTMQFSQEEVFWLLSQIVETVIPMDYYTNMVGVVCDQQLFLAILSKIHPEITQKFDQVGLEPSMLSLQWFVCLFTSSLPFYLVKIVWDRMLIEGPRAFIKAGLIIMKYFKEDILKVKQFHEIIMLLEKGTKNLTVPQAQFNACFQKIFISREGLVLARTLYREYHVKQKLAEGLTIKRKQSQDLQCDLKWPICVVSLEKKRKLRDQFKEESQIWIFRQGQPPQIDPQYLIRNKSRYEIYRSSKVTESSQKKPLIISNNYQQFIGRQPSRNYSESLMTENLNESLKRRENSMIVEQSYDQRQLTIGRMEHCCHIEKLKNEKEETKAKVRRSLLVEESKNNPLKSKNFKKLMNMKEDQGQQEVSQDQGYKRSQTIQFLSKFLSNNTELSNILIPSSNLYE